MKRLGILTLCVITVFALTAVATATDELPEIGRCVKIAGTATHKWANASCTIRSEGENTGKYEWDPGPGPKPGFTSTAEATELETVAKSKVKCSAATAKGEFTGPKSDAATIIFTGCEYGTAPGLPCQTPGSQEGEVATSRLEGALGYISGGGTAKPSVGMRLSPAPGMPFASVECGGVTLTLAGSVIGTIAGSVNKMSQTSSLKFRQGKGKQIPEQFEGAPPSVLSATAGAEPEQAGMSTLESNTNEEPLEVKAIG
jgi:hypothetical protein